LLKPERLEPVRNLVHPAHPWCRRPNRVYASLSLYPLPGTYKCIVLGGGLGAHLATTCGRRPSQSPQTDPLRGTSSDPEIPDAITRGATRTAGLGQGTPAPVQSQLPAW